ncbi:MAG: PIN domain-containing protein [Limnohabitans sp.]
MKVLIDTSVWSQALRRQKVHTTSLIEARAVDLLKELIHDGRVALLGPVRQELLSGVKTKVQFENLLKILDVFPDVPLSNVDYELAAQSFNQCRQAGVQGSNTDFLICAVSLNRAWPVLSLDKDFERFQKHLPLSLFKS